MPGIEANRLFPVFPLAYGNNTRVLMLLAGMEY